MTCEEAAAIYRWLYWEAVRADDLPPGIDLATFDLAVHSRPSRAVKMLRSVLCVETDGIVGPQTLQAAWEANPADTIRRLVRNSLGFLSRLAT